MVERITGGESSESTFVPLLALTRGEVESDYDVTTVVRSSGPARLRSTRLRWRFPKKPCLLDDSIDTVFGRTSVTSRSGSGW